MSGVDEVLLERLAGYAAEWTGFSRDAILPDAIRRAAAQLAREEAGGLTLLERAATGERRIVHALCQAVSVGETFFFRHPEHFRYLASTLLPELRAGGRTAIRAWSAGCATGEEAYSIAACLLDLLPGVPAVPVEVVGTDLLERNLAAARAGTYGTWSRRPSGPLLHPLFHAIEGGRVSIDDRVRRVTRFRLHNLLEPCPDGPFDLIFCRNVLVYFSPAAGKRAVGHLAAALAPGGALCFGSMDVGEAPPELTAGPSELQIFRRPFPRAQPDKPLPLVPAAKEPRPPPVPAVRAPEPVALHLRALAHIERGEHKLAALELTELAGRRPDYLPALLERALLHVRMGERGAAATLMREVLKRTETAPAGELLPGPEPLPVSFYRDSAQAFLRAARGGLG